MNCQEIQEFLSVYLDGELENEQRHEIEEHLKQCPSCSAEKAALQEAMGMIAAFPEIEPSPAFTERIMLEVGMRVQQQAINKVFFFIFAGLAGVLLTAAFGLSLTWLGHGLITLMKSMYGITVAMLTLLTDTFTLFPLVQTMTLLILLAMVLVLALVLRRVVAID